MTERKTTLAPTPSWKRLAGGTAAVFLAILALLGARVAAGADPALRATTTKAKATKASTAKTARASTAAAPSDPNPPTTQAS